MDLKMIITHLCQTKCIKYMAVPQRNFKICAQNLFGSKHLLGKHYIKNFTFQSHCKATIARFPFILKFDCSFIYYQNL